MPSVLELSPDDRALLKELPFKAVFAAVVTDVRGPVGSAAKETVEGARRLVSEATTTYAENALIQQVLQDVANDPATEQDIELKDETARIGAVVDALRIASEGASLLGDIEDQDQVLQYKQWVVSAATAAVEATRSGGILRGDQVSESEEDYIRQLRVALGLISGDEG